MTVGRSVAIACKNWWVSPYINRFLQPDSIIPDPLNPQSWDRYSYTVNNPILYRDSTGHSPDTVAFQEGEPPILIIITAILAALAIREHRERRHDAGRDDCLATLAECFNRNETKNFADHQTINQQEFNDMLDAINADLRRKSRTRYDLARAGYDTPFFNGDSMLDRNDQVDDSAVCIGDKCSYQSAINYVAQGMYSAYTGQSLKDAKELADNWNNFWYDHDASDDEEYWVEYGYNYFVSNKENNKPKTINKNLNIQVAI
jgi:hypothetical protein